MSETYKLTYFNLRGRAECARQLFVLADVPYEDVRLSKDEWKNVKSDTPFGQLPLLEVNGTVIAQSTAIKRYLAGRFGYAGKTPIEEALVDSIVDASVDYQKATGPHFMIVMGASKGDADEVYENSVLPACEIFFGAMQQFLAKSNSGFLVGNGVTWADLQITEILATQKAVAAPHLFDKYPEIEAYVERIQNLPKIREWMRTRPVTPY